MDEAENNGLLWADADENLYYRDRAGVVTVIPSPVVGT